MKLHHFFILVKPGAPEADLLSDIGLSEGPANHHPGQGTSNRRFFFANGCLELLYISDPTEATQGRAAKLRLVERGSTPGASPVGLVVRDVFEPGRPPFPGWHYCPEYFNEGQCFHIGANSDLLEEPLCICMPPGVPDPARHSENPSVTLTALTVDLPVSRPSGVLDSMKQCRGVSLRLNRPHLLQAVFNHGVAGQSWNFTPDLPLSIRW